MTSNATPASVKVMGANGQISLAACRTLVVDSEKRPRRGHFLTISLGNGRTIAQEMGEKGAVAVLGKLHGQE